MVFATATLESELESKAEAEPVEVRSDVGSLDVLGTDITSICR